ncbi:hypothetical protein XaC1_66 [Xanthomonas phage XaC1]|nr:hypothetical protein XaC1_66 [Xanthomonas phage XaC1]
MSLYLLLSVLLGECFSTGEEDSPNIQNCTLVLIRALNMTDGDVYALARITGLSVQDIVNLSTHEHQTREDATGINDFGRGRNFGYSPDEIDKFKGNTDYWKGVLYNQYYKESTLLA